MVTQVLDSKDQATAVMTGVIPVPPEVAVDNAKRDGKPITKTVKPIEKVGQESVEDTQATPESHTEADDIEGDDGLTPRQKRELTKKMQTSIGKKHRQLKEAEEFAAAQYNEKQLAETRAAEAERELQRLKGNGVAQVVNDGTDRPKPESFTDQGEYEKAVIDWRVNEILKERDRTAAQQAEQERQAKVAADAVSRLDRAREIVPDFTEVTGSVDTLVPPHIGAAMMESDKFAELGYYFAKNPEELEKLAKMSQARGLVALGKIEAIIKPFESGKPAAKSNGAKPSQDGSTPSTETGASQTSPSKPRAAAPITPLSTSSEPQVEALDSKNVREAINKYARDKSVNILNRKRH